MRIKMNVNGNQGYGPDQIESPISLGDLLEQVQEAIMEWGEDAEVVLHQVNNRYGANYGNLVEGFDLFESADDDDEGEW